VRPTLAKRFSGLLKLVAIIAAAAIGGTVIGIGLSKVSGDGDSGLVLGADPSATTAARSADTATAAIPPTATTTTATTPAGEAQAPIPAQGARVPSVKIVSATIFPAATAAGRARQRARVSIRVTVTNRDTKSLTPPNPLLLTGQDRIGFDPRASDLADPLIKPLGASKTATGELRFEISGGVTRRLNAKPRARLAIVGRVVALKMTISPSPAPPD